jgi:hypothetical protein
MSRFWKHLLRRIPRHGEGLLGVGAAYASAVYLAVLVSEIISSFLGLGYTSLNKAIFSFITSGDLLALPTLGVFMLVLLFLVTIAFAGSTRYLMGCVDPDHIAQRTFAIGLRLYTKRMLVYSLFVVIMLSAFIGFGYGIVKISVLFWSGAMLKLAVIFAIALLGILLVMLMSKLAYTPMFMIQGFGLFGAMSKSWGATKKRFWIINLVRFILVGFVFLPILLKWLFGMNIYVPSIDIWPYAALIVAGFEEIIVAIGFHEFEEEKKEPIISKAFASKDLQLLEDYTKHEGYSDPGGSMEL